MLRRGTGGYYVNGVVTRFPAAGVSLRDAETYARAGSVATPDLTTADFALRNIYFSELGGPMFQANTATPANQFSFDAAGNSLTAGTATGAALFTAIPATGSSSERRLGARLDAGRRFADRLGRSGDVHRQAGDEGRHVRHRHELRRRSRRRRREVVVGLDDLRPQLNAHH